MSCHHFSSANFYASQQEILLTVWGSRLGPRFSVKCSLWITTIFSGLKKKCLRDWVCLIAHSKERISWQGVVARQMWYKNNYFLLLRNKPSIWDSSAQLDFISSSGWKRRIQEGLNKRGAFLFVISTRPALSHHNNSASFAPGIAYKKQKETLA